MIGLPRGLFILKKESNIQPENIDNLTNISIKLSRNIDIVTDIATDSIEHEMVRLIKIPDSYYDYVFISGKISDAKKEYDNITGYLKEEHWICYMVPIDNYISQVEATNIKSKIGQIGYNAVVVPKVKHILGGEMFLLFNNDDMIVQLDGGNHHILWGNIFRACGFYSVKTGMIVDEFSP